MFTKDFKIHKVKSIPNTNEAAFDLIKNDKNVVVVAQMQDYGKTRNGHDWISGHGNLLMSIGFSSRVDHLGMLVLMVAVSIGSVLKEYNPFYKWPNDIFIHGKKVCGVLAEREDDKIVIGIGINVANSPGGNATHLNKYKEYDLDILPNNILNALRYSQENLYTFSIVKKLWEERAMLLGEKIDFDDGDKIVSGKFIGVAQDGALMLQNEQITTKFHSGSICITT